MQVSVQNGTHAGWRVAHEARKDPWSCDECGQTNKPNYASCFGCTSPRPRGAK
jgi:hypothetical protein